MQIIKRSFFLWHSFFRWLIKKRQDVLTVFKAIAVLQAEQGYINFLKKIFAGNFVGIKLVSSKELRYGFTVKIVKT